MFAEYASLYMCNAGQFGASVPSALTLDIAEDISEQATRSVFDYVKPPSPHKPGCSCEEGTSVADAADAPVHRRPHDAEL